METQNITNKRGLVFTMGKVGSSTVMQAFRELDISSDRGYAENVDYLENYGLDNYVVVVTPVRDPIARNISWFFEKHGGDVLQAGDILNRKISNSVVLETFTKYINQDYPLNWFDGVFKPTFGVDVYKSKFAKTRGWSILKKRYIIVQTERMDEALPDAFEKFFGERPPMLHRAMTFETRPYGELYKEFVKTVKFPEEQIEHMYLSKFVQHFFTKKQVDAWREKWTK